MFRKLASSIAAKIKKNLFEIYAFLLGILSSSFALPSINHIILLPVALSLFLEILYNTHYKKRFRLGYSFGLGYFSISLSWIGNALLVEADKFAWLQPIALLLIPGVLAVYIGICCALTSFVKQTRLWLWLTFSTTWVALELVRSWFLIPFPWNLIGYSASYSLAFSQLASVVGIYGLSFIVMLVSTTFFTRSWRVILIMLTSLILITFWGTYRLSKTSADNMNSPFVVRIVQPNFAEHHFGDQSIRIKHINNLIEVSAGTADKAPDVIIWPEAVLPLYMNDDLLLKIIAHNLNTKNWLVSGADRVAFNNNVKTYHNSMISTNLEGKLASFYDKHILVAFGEYIPLRSLMPNYIEKIAYGMGDFTIGKDYTLLDIGSGIKAIPLICYEAVFSTFINNFAIDKASILINVTNDSWFGDSLGPYQHLSISRFRAIEYGKPLMRAANNGISAAFDSYGIELGTIPLNKRGYLDVQASTSNIKTLYPQNMLLLQAFLCLLLFICYARPKN